MNGMVPAARLEHVRFSYDNGVTWVLDGIDLTIRSGERLCLVGPNGSGKSTLARLIAGLAAPDGGDMTLLGHHVFDGETASANPSEYRNARHGIGTVFQNPEDQIVTTIVEDDVAFGPENLGVARDDIGGRIDESLQSVDMAGFRHADPTRMSGGQQQRIAIAGMLAMDPRMLVLDEPTAMLDPDARIEVMRILDMLQRRGTTIVLVTHHHDETMHADRVLRIDGGLLTQVEADRDAIAAKQVIARSHADATDAAGSTESAAEEPGGSTAAASPAQPAKSGQPVKPASTKSDASPIPPTGSTSDAIAVSGLSYRYDDGDAPVFENLSLRVAEGEIVALMGANGAGKTTLARLLCALDRPSAGSITVAGLPVASSKHGKRPRALTRKERAALRRNVGYVMQHPERQLFADTVAEDVAYGPRNQHLSELEVATRVEEALRMLHIEHLADRSPFNLSGGQQRLVAIAGVIACRPRVLIMDEPTASLDESAVSRIHALLGSLKSQGVAVLIITHSIDEAEHCADRIITIGSHNGDGEGDGCGTGDDGDTSVGDATESSTNAGKAGIESIEDESRNRPSFVASLDPRAKMVTFLTLMFTAFVITGPAQLAMGAVLTACVVAAARLHPLRLLSSVRVFLIVFAVMGLVNMFFARSGETLAHIGPLPITTGGLMVAVLYSCRLALVIILGAVFLATTTPTAMTDAFGSLLLPFRKLGWHTQEMALVMSLALRFLPTLSDETKAIIDAQSARGGTIETGSPATRVKALFAIIVPILVAALRHADNLSLALDARCYEEGIHRTHWRVMRARRRDLMVAAACVAYVVALLAVGWL